MKRFVKPEMSMIVLEKEDLITSSQTCNSQYCSNHTCYDCSEDPSCTPYKCDYVLCKSYKS